MHKIKPFQAIGERTAIYGGSKIKEAVYLGCKRHCSTKLGILALKITISFLKNVYTIFPHIWGNGTGVFIKETMRCQ
jgi:hypothetical protein